MRNVTRFFVLGGALVFMTACSLGGFGGAMNGTNMPKSSGIKRYTMGSNVGYYQPDGSLKSTNGAVKWSSPWANGVSVVQSHVLRQADFDVCYRGTCIASQQGDILMDTSDTSGDGWISGNIGNCNLTSGVGYLLTMPAAAAFRDTSTCPNGGDPDFSTSTTEYPGYGRASIDQDPGGTNALGVRIPFSVMQDVVNSVEASDVTTYTDERGPHQTIRAQVTNVRIGGASYRPQGVFVKITDMQPLFKVHKTNPGAKLMAAWMAGQIEKALDRGATNLRGSFTLNGSATISSDLAAGTGALWTSPNRSMVERLREFATSNVRGD